MQENKAPWLAVAMAAPLAHYCGGSWLSLLVVGVIIGGLNRILPHPGQKNPLEPILVTVLLAQFLPSAALYWPGKWSEMIVPVVMVLLSIWACGKDPAKVCGILLPLMTLILIPTAAAAIKDANIQWMEPKGMEMNWLLIPALLLFGTEAGRQKEKWYWGTLIFGTMVGVLASSVLSPGIVSAVPDPLRQMGRALHFGAASRFEPVISIFMTFAWFGTATLLLDRAGKWKYVTVLASVILSGFSANWMAPVTAVFAIIVWVFPIILTLKKTSKKSEKSA